RSELLSPVQPVAERLALDVRHDVVEEAFRLSRIVQRQDVGMTEARGGLDLPEKPLAAEGGRELRRQHLDRHRPIVLQVPGEVDGCHPSAAELALDSIATGDSGLKAKDGVE